MNSKRVSLPCPSRLKLGKKSRLHHLMATRILRLFPPVPLKKRAETVSEH